MAEGDQIQVDLGGVERLDGVVDYLRPNYIGIRTAGGLYPFFGRNPWGMPVGVALPLTQNVDVERTKSAWRGWLEGIYP
jgi:hypothetical protein